MRDRSLQNEDGAILIFSLLLLSVSIVFITAMNKIVYNNSHRFTKEKKQEQAKSLAKAGLEKAVGKLKSGKLVLGEFPAENLGSMGSYKLDSQLAGDGSVIISSTGQVDDTNYQLSTIKKVARSEVDINQFSSASEADNWKNVAGGSYTIKFKLNPSQQLGHLNFKNQDVDFDLNIVEIDFSRGTIEGKLELDARPKEINEKTYSFVRSAPPKLELTIKVDGNYVKIYVDSEADSVLEVKDNQGATGITGNNYSLNSSNINGINVTTNYGDNGFEILPDAGNDGVLELTGKQHYYKNISYSYEKNKVYRVETRIKQELEDGTCYLGVQGLDSSDNLVNIAGANKYEDQYYMSLDNIELKSGAGWKTFVGYFSAHSNNQNKIETSVDNNPRSAIILNPMPLRNDVAKFRPVFIANENNGSGITKIDYFKVEQLKINNN